MSERLREAAAKVLEELELYELGGKWKQVAMELRAALDAESEAEPSDEKRARGSRPDVYGGLAPWCKHEFNAPAVRCNRCSGWANLADTQAGIDALLDAERARTDEAERLLRLTCLQIVDGVEHESLAEMRSHQSPELADISLAIGTAWNSLLIELEKTKR